MDLYQLRVLRELADHGSIAATARSLAVTPSAISQVIAALQADFRAPLTRKRGRIVEISDAGLALANASAGVAAALASARSSVDTYLDDFHSLVKVSAFHSAAQSFFPPLIALSENGDFPAVEFADEDVAQAAFPALTAGYDVVIAHRLSHSTPWPTDRLAVVPLITEPMDVAMRADHRLAARKTISPQDLLGETWISTHEGFPPAELLGSLSAAAGHPMTVTHRINDYSTAAALVATSKALAFIPRYTVVPLENTGIVLRPLAGIRPSRNIDLLLRPEHLSRRAVEIVVESLRSIAGDRKRLAENGSADPLVD